MGQGRQRGVMTDADGRATIDLAPALAAGVYDADSTLAVSIAILSADYQRSYRYSVGALLRPYYTFGIAPYSVAPGGEPDGTTATDLAYEVIEMGGDNAYRIALADRSERWVTSAEASWTAFRASDAPPVIGLSSLQGESPARAPAEASLTAALRLGVGVTRALLVGVDRYEHHAAGEPSTGCRRYRERTPGRLQGPGH